MLFNRQTVFLLLLVFLVTSCQPATATSVPETAVPEERGAVEVQPISGGPTLLWSGIEIRKVKDLYGGPIRLVLHPLTGDLYILNPGTGINKIQISTSDDVEPVATVAEIVDNAYPTGMAFAPDGTLFVVANRTVDDVYNQGIIRKGVANTEGVYEWSTFAESEPYPLSATPFDHMFNGIVVSPDGAWVYVNSGSRTDHGEEEKNKGTFPGAREVGLTSKIFRIPSDAENLVLVNDEEKLKELGLIFAWGVRNTYDMAFAPNGDLFGGDNGPDADLPDELNWLREGQHYGFPWKFGDQDNPQQFPDYTSINDKRLSPDFTAVQMGAYRRDPDFPPAPGNFTLPVANLGPAATQYRAEDGSQKDAASEGKPLYTFTPHRSPLGLVFVSTSDMPPDLRSSETTLSAFILSWGSAGGTLTDRGQDLLNLQLTKDGDSYSMTTIQIATGFNNPIDAVLIGNKLYVLDFGANGTLWELTFK